MHSLPTPTLTFRLDSNDPVCLHLGRAGTGRIASSHRHRKGRNCERASAGNLAVWCVSANVGLGREIVGVDGGDTGYGRFLNEGQVQNPSVFLLSNRIYISEILSRLSPSHHNLTLLPPPSCQVKLLNRELSFMQERVKALEESQSVRWTSWACIFLSRGVTD